MPAITPATTGKEPYEAHQAIIIKAGTPLNYGVVYAANHLAGTTGRELIEALNILAGNPKNKYRELAGVLNQLAGTSGLETQGAASRWAGR